jgi:hypothetical protein
VLQQTFPAAQQYPLLQFPEEHSELEEQDCPLDFKEAVQ